MVFAFCLAVVLDRDTDSTSESELPSESASHISRMRLMEY